METTENERLVHELNDARGLLATQDAEIARLKQVESAALALIEANRISWSDCMKDRRSRAESKQLVSVAFDALRSAVNAKGNVER